MAVASVRRVWVEVGAEAAEFIAVVAELEVAHDVSAEDAGAGVGGGSCNRD